MKYSTLIALLALCLVPSLLAATDASAPAPGTTAGAFVPATPAPQFQLAPDGALLATGSHSDLYMQGQTILLHVQWDPPFVYHARHPYFRRIGIEYDRREPDKHPLLQVLGRLRVGDAQITCAPPWRGRYDGILRVDPEQQPVAGLNISFEIYPARKLPVFAMEIVLRDTSGQPRPTKSPEAGQRISRVERKGEEAKPTEMAWFAPAVDASLPANGELRVPVYVYVTEEFPSGVKKEALNARAIRQEQVKMWEQSGQSCRLTTPDPWWNAAHRFAILRTIFSPMYAGNTGSGKATTRPDLSDPANWWLMPTTGAGYAPGVWANDSVESTGPLFAYVGDPDYLAAGWNVAELWNRRNTLDAMKAGRSLVGSFEGFPLGACQSGRGDESMFLYGFSGFLLAAGDRQRAEKYWPLIEKCLASIQARTRPEGVVGSPTDEGEGRWRTGPVLRNQDNTIPPTNANFSTNALAYAGLRQTALLAQSLGKQDIAKEITQRAEALDAAMEKFFGAEIKGIHGYRYYDGCTEIFGWSTMAPACGILRRADGCFAAGRSIWSPKTHQLDAPAAWSKCTSYYLRGLFLADRPDEGHLYLRDFVAGQIFRKDSRSAPHINCDGPIAIEAAVFSRIAIDGLFGIAPAGFDRFTVKPSMPSSWNTMSLERVQLCGVLASFRVERSGKQLHLSVTDAGGNVLLDQTGREGSSWAVVADQLSRHRTHTSPRELP